MTVAQEKAFVRSAYENFPEASECLSCIRWKYKEFSFTFLDVETEEQHVVLEVDAVRGLRLLVAAVSRGELKGLTLPANYLDPEEGLGEWDAWAFDALNQMAIFGKVIYG